MGRNGKQGSNRNLDDFIADDESSGVESSPEPDKSIHKRKTSHPKKQTPTKESLKSPVLNKKAAGSVAAAQTAPKQPSAPPKTGRLTEAERMDKSLLDELIGESTDDGNNSESEDYYTAGESQSEDYDSDTVSEEDLKPRKFRKITADATPTRASFRLKTTSASSPPIKTPTQPDSAATMIKPKAISSPARENNNTTFQGYDAAGHVAEQVPDTPTGSSKFAAISLESNPPLQVITTPQAWFSPDKKPDYENSRGFFDDRSTAGAIPAPVPVNMNGIYPNGPTSQTSFYHADSEIEDDDAV